MKKTLMAMAVLGSLTATSVPAATVLGFKVGGDYWNADASGTFAEKGQPQQEFGYDSSARYSLWLAIEHPIPFLPNLKIRENHLEEDGTLADADMSFSGIHYTGETYTNVDLGNTDFIGYYELLDNDILSLDVGAAYKKFDGSIRVYQGSKSATLELSKGVFMGYANAELGLPGSGLFAYADILTGIDESSVYDYQLGLGWQFDGIALDTRIHAGYRTFNFDVNDFDGASADMKFDGVFAGVEVVF
ncbi:TIGR04219 family outer membrane beta-barrel protein [Shewanella dokdonensis]|uniref:TIGR04219 family outer membrane beta-barrel protein n=1 Tax=Shewanella dokdonensis TaxID=712036 RepID=A0ABX8DBN3_9GAMM|nr:TIGR04219 family outer membrane beta-barrel protein [Shewanella dokdonensis]MCL1074808.1 TIGR04219 family outer membrane beta-barrel protein [Shewanella dokdonensis]QVK22218.1 TIGR04219 family outer membrane beta-barrel protein [Shewanella dokdonensis]